MGVERGWAVSHRSTLTADATPVLNGYQNKVAVSTAQPVKAAEQAEAAHHDDVDGLHCQQLEARGLVDALVHQAGEGHTYCGTGSGACR